MSEICHSPEVGSPGRETRVESGEQQTQQALADLSERERGGVLQAIAEKAKKYKLALALTFLLSTQVAKDTYSQEIIQPPESPPGISFLDTERGKRTLGVYQKEVKRLKALGYELKIENRFLIDYLPVDGGLAANVAGLGYEIKGAVEEPAGCSPEKLQNVSTGRKDACSLLEDHKEDAQWLGSFQWQYGGENPLKTLEGQHGQKRDVDALLSGTKAGGTLGIPAFFIEERELPDGQLEVEFFNWVSENPIVIKKIISKQEAGQVALEIFKKLPNIKKSSEESLSKLDSSSGESLQQVYERMEEPLTPEQAERLRNIFERVESIEIHALPLNRYEEADFYGSESSDLVLDKLFVAAEEIPRIRINGQPYAIVIKAKTDAQFENKKFSRITDQWGNVVQFTPADRSGIESVMILPRLFVCNGARCSDARPLVLNLGNLGLGMIGDLLVVREQRPLSQVFPKQAVYPLYSNLSAEHIQSRMLEPLREFYRGIRDSEELFGKRNEVVGGVYLVDTISDKQAMAFYNSQTVGVSDEVLKVEPGPDILGKHEALHHIGERFHIHDYPKFEKLHQELLARSLISVEGKEDKQLDPHSFLSQITEKNFFGKERSGGGHAQDNSAELFAALGNSIQEEENAWKVKVDLQDGSFVKDYRDALVVLQEVVKERLEEGKLKGDAPIFRVLRERIGYLEAKIK